MKNFRLTKKQKELYQHILDNEAEYQKNVKIWKDAGKPNGLYVDIRFRGIELYGGFKLRSGFILSDLDLIEIWTNENGHPIGYVKGYMEASLNSYNED